METNVSFMHTIVLYSLGNNNEMEQALREVEVKDYHALNVDATGERV